MEVKINEIRVGNIFIGYDDKLFSWGLKDFCLLDLHTEIDEIIKLPVEISEQILLKVGFVNEFSNSWSNHVLQIFKNTGNVAGSDIGDFYVSTGQRYVTSFKHLHQLQNLYFALTGQELDVSKLI